MVDLDPKIHPIEAQLEALGRTIPEEEWAKIQPGPVRFLARNNFLGLERYMLSEDKPTFDSAEGIWDSQNKQVFATWVFMFLFPTAPRLEPGEGPIRVRLNMEVVDDPAPPRADDLAERTTENRGRGK